MPTHWTRMLAVVPMLALLGAAQVRADDAKVVRAREILKLLIDGKYKEFVATGDQAVRAGFSPEKAGQVWAGLLFQLGGYQSEESAELVKAGEQESVSFVLRFERGTCTLRVVLDQSDKMSGFWCDAINPSADYKAPPYVDESSFREEDVTVSAGQFPLPGKLTLPKAPGPHPGIVLVHGSGPNDQDETVGANKPFRDLAWGLASRGVAVLRYEKRTRVHPLAKPAAEWTLEDEVIDDAIAAAELLRKHKDIDPKRVYVLGHSLGGTLAPYIAQKDGKLAGIVIMAGSARSILDLLEEQTEYIATLGGQPSEKDRQELDKLKQQLAAIRAGKTQDVTEPILSVPAVYWERLHKLDPAGVAAKLETPMLILQGGRDYQVTKKDFTLWKERLGNHKSVTLKLFDDLNHLFIAGQGPSTPAEYQQAGHVDEKVIGAIRTWIMPQAQAAGAKEEKKD